MRNAQSANLPGVNLAPKIAPNWFIWFNVTRRDLVLTIFSNQFSLFKSFSNYFQILIFIPVERSNCWDHLDVICFC